jgi:hypothetical protein
MYRTWSCERYERGDGIKKRFCNEMDDMEKGYGNNVWFRWLRSNKE